MSFVKHAPCEACGSSDAKAIYDDGSTYCFSCETATGNGEKHQVAEGLLQGLSFKPLEARKLTQKTCRKFGYGVTKHHNQFWQVASYYRQGNMVAQHLRGATKSFRWLGKPKGVELFGQHLWQQGGKRLIITEGEIDCLSISQALNHKWPVVSLPNGASSAARDIKANLEYIESFHQIVLAFDDDDPGRSAVEKAVELLTPGKVHVMKYEGLKDANEMLLSGMGAMISQGVFQAKKYRPDSILAGKELWEMIQKETPPGLKTPYPKLNEAFHGFRPKELYLFTAGSGIGKSTVAKEILWEFFQQGQKIGVLSLEEGVKRATEGFMSLYLNHPIHVERPPQDKLKEAFDYLTHEDRYFIYDHWGSSQIDAILNKIKFMAVALGCQWILLDHISIIVSGSDEMQDNERKLIDLFMSKLRTMIENTGIGVLAIVHLKRPKDGKSYNEGRVVTLSDLRGSGSLEQLSDGVIALERDQQGQQKNISTVRILKNRPIGVTGVMDALAYNPMTGRLLTATDEDFINNQKEAKAQEGFVTDDF